MPGCQKVVGAVKAALGTDISSFFGAKIQKTTDSNNPFTGERAGFPAFLTFSDVSFLFFGKQGKKNRLPVPSYSTGKK